MARRDEHLPLFVRLDHIELMVEYVERLGREMEVSGDYDKYRVPYRGIVRQSRLLMTEWLNVLKVVYGMNFQSYIETKQQVENMAKYIGRCK